VKFQELSDIQWNIIQKHLPKPARTVRPRSDDKMTIKRIIYVLITGCRWSEMPKRYGSKSTAHRRLQNWQQNNVWKNILSDVIKTTHQSGKLNLQKISVDSSSIPAKKVAM
jgi:transposase